MIIPEAIPRRRLTLDDYEALPDDADYEIIDGVLYVSPRARPGHQALAFKLGNILFGHIEPANLGMVLPDADLVVDYDNTYVSPDLMYFTADKYAQIDPDDFVQVVPDLVVEILSPGTEHHDLVTKRNTYARLGVRYYWTVSKRKRSIEENVLGEDGQYRSLTVAAPDVFVPAMFPGLRIDLDAIFE